MFKKSLFIFLSLVMLAAIVLSACAPAATTTPTEAPAVEPTDEVAEPVEEPAEEPSEPATWKDTDPYKAYPETVSMVLVKGGQENAASLPEGETIGPGSGRWSSLSGALYRGPVMDYRAAFRADRQKGRRFALGLFDKGIFLNPMGTKMYLSLAHTEEDIQKLIRHQQEGPQGNIKGQNFL